MIYSFRYVLKNKKTNKIKFSYFSLQDIENTTDFEWEVLKNRYKIINRDIYTNKKDKYGYEIYTNDIIRCMLPKFEIDLETYKEKEILEPFIEKVIFENGKFILYGTDVVVNEIYEEHIEIIDDTYKKGNNK